MTVKNWPRLIIVSILSFGLALGLGAQALSSVSTRKAPETAAALFPANGLAVERLAFETFAAGVTEPEDATAAARAASEIALSAVRKDPLVPQAHAILALAANDAAARRAILDAASQLNRRNISLQGLVLQEHLAAEDAPQTIETLNQILRVHPEYSREFFPVLNGALEEEDTLELFAEMLDNSSPWHARFLNFAVGQRGSLQNLALLRPQIEIENEVFDRRLIAGLAGSGDVAAAEALYRDVTGAAAGLRSQGVIDWRSDFPPFDWRLVDETGFRAQKSLNGQELELSVRPGKGGVIAARLLAAPAGPFEVRIGHRIAPADQLRDVRLQLICAGTTTPFFDERFSRQGDGFKVQSLPEDCAYLVLAINARAWSGRSALSGNVEQIRLTELAR